MAESINLGKVFVEIRAEQEQIKKDLDQIRRESAKSGERIEKELKGNFSNITSFVKTQAKAIGGFIAGAFAIDAVVEFGRKIVDTAKEFEFLKTRLQSYFKTQKEANEAFDEFVKLASTSPFSLREITEASATLEAFGISSRKQLTAVQDLAAFMGRDLVDAAGAVGRAFAGGIGAADILRETGVINRILTATGRTVQDFSKDIEGFRQAIFQTIADPNQGITGSAERLSQTLTGAFSNLGDAFDNFANAIGSKASPAIINLVKGATDLLERITPVQSKLDEITKAASDQRIEFETLAATYTRLANTTERSNVQNKLLKDTIEEINRTVAARSRDITVTADPAQGEKALNQIRTEMRLREASQSTLAKEKDLIAETERARLAVIEKERELSRETAILNERLKTTNESALAIFGLRSNTRDIERQLAEEQEKFNTALKNQVDFQKEYNLSLKNAATLLADVEEKGKKLPKPPRPEQPTLPPIEIDIPDPTEGDLPQDLPLFLNTMEESAVQAAEGIAGAFASTFDLIKVQVSETSNVFERTFANIANAVISQIQRMIAEMLSFLALRAILGGASLGLASPGGGGILGALFGGGSPEQIAVPGGASLVSGAVAPSPIPAIDTSANLLSSISTLQRQVSAQSQFQQIASTRERELNLNASIDGTVQGNDIVLSYDRTKGTEIRNG